MWPFSYRLWAACIVRRAVKPSLRLASCCKVLVVNGGYGFDVNGLSSSAVTPKSALPQLFEQLPARRFVQQQQAGVFELAGGRIEIFASRNACARRPTPARP